MVIAAKNIARVNSSPVLWNRPSTLDISCNYYYTTELAITNKRVIAKFGLIRRNTVEMNISKVESIQVDQGILGRIFNFGSVLVSGAGDPKAPIPGISHPLKFRKMFFEVQEGGSATPQNNTPAEVA